MDEVVSGVESDCALSPGKCVQPKDSGNNHKFNGIITRGSLSVCTLDMYVSTFLPFLLLVLQPSHHCVNA